MFSRSLNVNKLSSSAKDFINDDREGCVVVNDSTPWCTFSYKPNGKTERVFTASQLFSLADSDNNTNKVVFMNILMNFSNCKPLDAYTIASSGFIYLVEMQGILESEKKKLLATGSAKLKKNAKFLTNNEFLELIESSLVQNQDAKIVRCLNSCAFQYLKHRRFTPTSACSKFMVDIYFPELVQQKEPTEQSMIDLLTNCPETTLTEEFLQKMCHELGHQILVNNTKAYNNIRQLSAGSKPYKICHNIDLNGFHEIVKKKLKTKNKLKLKKNIKIFKNHLDAYNLTAKDLFRQIEFVSEMRRSYSKDECYATFCMTGDPNLNGIYPNNLLNVCRRTWFFFFTFKLLLQGKQVKPAIKEIMGDVEVKSYWERVKNKPQCTFDTLRAGAPDIKMGPEAVRGMDKTPLLEFLKTYYPAQKNK